MAPGASEKLAMGTLTTDAATSPTTEAPMTLQVNLGHSKVNPSDQSISRSVDQSISPLEDPRGSKTPQQLRLGSKLNATELAVA